MLSSKSTPADSGARKRSRILVIDDDPKLRYIIELNLMAAGHEVFTAEDGPSGLALLREKQPDLVILDVMMPGMNGFDLCKTIREEPDLPDCSILFLTARGELADKGEGFSAGGDDYLVKPFDPRELLWRAEALLRRLRRPALTDRVVEVGSLKLYPATLEVKTPRGRSKLTRVEFLLLLVLAETPDQVVTTETLAHRVWGGTSEDNVAAMRVHINRLRQRIEPTPETPRYLRTVRGRGYMLCGQER